jgi:hypothetical protein
MSEIQCATKSEFYEAVKQVSEMGIPFTAYTDSLIVQVNIGER